MTADAEVTLETNPETVTVERMRGFRDGRRQPREPGRAVAHRRGTAAARTDAQQRARAREAVAEVRAAGFDNVSLDLMMWLPQQGMAEWQTTVDGLIALDPDHASLYLLELYPNAPLREAMARASWSLAPDDDAAEMYLWAMARLEASGYAQYEISNVARPGRESRHNLKYWRDGAWLGFGCGAHSTRGAAAMEERRRHHRVRRTRGARVASVAVERQTRTPQEQLEDALFTGLRLSEGVDLDAPRDVLRCGRLGAVR